jgi:hypothetical protein
VSIYDITAKWTIKGKLEKVNGEEYMNIYQFDVLPEARDMKMSASGLFPDEELSNNVNFRHFCVYFNIFSQPFCRQIRQRFLQRALASVL